LEQKSLDKLEVVRPRCLIQGFKIYKELFADYVHYCDIESELVELRRGHDELVQRAKDDSARATGR
jgi:hypothetical protein